MNMPKVLNQRTDGRPDGAVYIGRPSKWGNPFVIGKDGTRAEVVAKYERWLCESGPGSQVGELRGKDLVCWCAPLACHGDVLLRLANATQAGPLMVRHVIDGHEVLLPADAQLHAKTSPGDPLGLTEPLGGTY